MKYSDLSAKILNFLCRTEGGGAFAPEPLYIPNTALLATFFGGRPANFRIKLKLQEEI